MAFYDLDKEARNVLVAEINAALQGDIVARTRGNMLRYFSDEDTYIRKTAYLAIGRIYLASASLQREIIDILNDLFSEEDPKIRQTAINAAGEIGKSDFEVVRHFFDKGLFDEHHSVRNAVIGSMKKMGEKNPLPVIEWSKRYLHHTDKEIRREICHGIELRGRTHPQDVLPLLRQLQFDKTKRVYSTLVHVIGQIAYKKGCLETVLTDLLTWQNKELVNEAIEEIIDVHHRYRNFSYYTQEEARAIVEKFRAFAD